MATTIITPPSMTREDRGSGIGFFLGVLLLAAILFLVIYYGLSMFRPGGAISTTYSPGQGNNISAPQSRGR